MSIPRVGSMMSMNMGGNLGSGMMMPLGGSLGGPPDCIKSSYDQLHLTSDELNRLTRQGVEKNLLIRGSKFNFLFQVTRLHDEAVVQVTSTGAHFCSAWLSDPDDA